MFFIVADVPGVAAVQKMSNGHSIALRSDEQNRPVESDDGQPEQEEDQGTVGQKSDGRLFAFAAAFSSIAISPLVVVEPLLEPVTDRYRLLFDLCKR